LDEEKELYEREFHFSLFYKACLICFSWLPSFEIHDSIFRLRWIWGLKLSKPEPLRLTTEFSSAISLRKDFLHGQQEVF